MTSRTHPVPIIEEQSGPKRSTYSTLSLIATVVGLIVAMGTAIGVGGNAFFVGRAEYSKEKSEIAKEGVSQAERTTRIEASLDRLNEIVGRQEVTLTRLGEVLGDIRIQLGKTRATR